MAECLEYPNLKDLETNTFSGKQWKTVGACRRAGVAIPLSSLRNKLDYGCGDFSSLKIFIDWSNLSGNSIIQLLPLNALSRNDSSPYGAISAFAIDPVYFSIDEYLLNSKSKNESDIVEFLKTNKSIINDFSKSEYVNFKEVRDLKYSFFSLLFENYKSDKKFEKYKKDNNYWLKDFATFKVLKEEYNWMHWHDWPKEYKERDPDTISKFTKKHLKRINFFKFVQYQLEIQFLSIKKYAQKKKVLLLGDLPILISRDSADVWSKRYYFKTWLSAGAPPDMYCPDGQNWNLPPTDWFNLENDDYIWWEKRLKQAEKFYDIYRLDHIVGFFRLYSLKATETSGRDGAFDPPEENLWDKHGRKILEALLKRSNMLVTGEDLGVIPDCCRTAMKEMGIPGFKIMRWERSWNENSVYIQPKDYDPVSLASTGTHDSDTLRSWWQTMENPERKLFADSFDFDENKDIDLSKNNALKTIKELYNGASIFTILPLQDLLATENKFLYKDAERNRINVPGMVNDTNWKYRFKFTVEEMLGETFLNMSKNLKKIAKDSDRFC